MDRVANEGQAPSAPRGQTVLLMGYGNLSRRDDSVAWHIMRRVRGRLGLPDGELDLESDPAEAEGALVTCFVHQLAPEMAEALTRYDLVVFVDAHVEGAGWEPVHLEAVEPVLTANMISHHLRPASLMALCASLYGRCPQGYVLTVLGHDFDFGEELAPDTSRRADEAVERLLTLLRAHGVEAAL